MKDRPACLNVIPVKFMFILLVMLCLTIPLDQAQAAYSTPSKGVTWSLDDLVANSDGAVTGSSPNYAIHSSVVISYTDTLLITPETAITLTATMDNKNGEASHIQIVVLGRLEAKGTNDNPVTFTAFPQTRGQWDGIRVTHMGSVDLEYAKVLYGGNTGLLLDYIPQNAKSSRVDHCLFAHSDEYGVGMYTYDAPTLTISNSVFKDCGTHGLGVFKIGQTTVNIDKNFFYDNRRSGVIFSGGGVNTSMTGNLLADNRMYGVQVQVGTHGLTIQNNFIYDNLEGIGINTELVSSGDNILIDSNVIADNRFSGIWSYYAAGQTITNNAISENYPGVYLHYTWNSLVAGNEIGRTQLDGSLFKLSDLDLPFGFNDMAAIAIDGDPADMMLSGNGGEGVMIEGAIPGMGAEPTDYNWIEVNRTNADVWDDQDGEAVFPEKAIGFDFPITYCATLTDTVYTHFQMQSNGVVELLKGAGQAGDTTNSNGRGHIIRKHPERTFLFANASEWMDLTSVQWDDVVKRFEDYEEFHNGALVPMNGWGYKHFKAGETDGDGQVVPEDCVVFRWYVTAVEDYICDSVPWNDFQAVIYPDGKIVWSTRFLRGRYNLDGGYAGLYAGSHDQPLEIQATWNMKPQTSYLFDPKTAREVTTQVAANNLVNNNNEVRKNGIAPGGIGIAFSDFQIIRGNVISNNYPGIHLFGESTHDTMIRYNDIYCPVNKQGGHGIWNNTGNPVDAEKNYWYTDNPEHCVSDPDVDVAPWLPQAIPPVEEAGVLLADPTKICSAGGVITVTGRLYPNTKVTIPEMAVDEPITFTVGDMLPMPAMPPVIDRAGIPMAIGPSGTQFNTPATADIPYAGFSDPNAVFYYIPETGKWSTRGLSLKDVNRHNRTIKLNTSHLTTFSAARLELEEDLPEIVKHNEDWFDCFINSLK